MSRAAMWAAAIVLLHSIVVGAQTGVVRPPGTSPERANEMWRRRQEQYETERRARMQEERRALARRGHLSESATVDAQPFADFYVMRDRVLEARKSISFPSRAVSAETIGEDAPRVLPDAEDKEKYRQFLKISKTGIVRLFPDLGCSSNTGLTVDVGSSECENAVLTLPGNGSFYSFRTASYTVAKAADVRFVENTMITENPDFQGLLVDLGRIEIEMVKPDSVEFAALRKYVPGRERAEIVEQQQQLQKGFAQGNNFIRSQVVLEVGNTYLLRAITYRNNISVYDPDKESDAITAFQVIRRGSDGSVVLVWREFNRRTAPKVRS